MTPAKSERVDLLIVGGGFAGVRAAVAAADLRERSEQDVRIAVLTREPWLTLRPRLYEADLDRVRVALPEVLEPIGVELVLGEVDRIDVQRRLVVTGDGRTLHFGRLVLASGSRLRAPALRAASGTVHDVDTYEAATAMRRHLEAVARSARPLEERYTVVVVGAGFAGLETATDLAATLTRLAAEGGAAGRERVVLVESAPSLATLHGANPAAALAEALAATGVEIRCGRRVVEVTESGATLDDGTFLAAGTVVWTAGLEPSPLLHEVATHLDERGRLVVDEFLAVDPARIVFAAGDVAAGPIGADRTTVMSCQHAIPMGETAGRNAMASLLGQALEPFHAELYVTCIDLGAAGALFTVGWDRTPVATGAAGKAIKREIIDVIDPRRWTPATAEQAPADGPRRRSSQDFLASVVRKERAAVGRQAPP